MFYLQKPNINKEETHEGLYHDKAWVAMLLRNEGAGTRKDQDREGYLRDDGDQHGSRSWEVPSDSNPTLFCKDPTIIALTLTSSKT